MIIYTDSTRYLFEVLEQGEYGFAFDNLVVMDLGCNVGAFSLWIYPRARIIHAIDMEEKYLSFFRQTIKDNELTDIVLYKDKVLDLSNFISGHKIPKVDLLKIDVEGDEVEIFENNFPSNKVYMIVGEYHLKPVKDILERIGYEYFEYPNKHFLARRNYA